MALGAGVSDIAGLVYRSILVPSVIGLSAGAAASVVLAPLLKHLIFEGVPADFQTIALTACAILVVSTLAASGPAMRAAFSDPAKTLCRDAGGRR